jgi:hypothetical protein
MQTVIVKKPDSILTNRYLHLYSLYLFSFLIPFLLKGPQLLTGTLVNFLLIVGISQFKLKEIFPILLIPSLTACLGQALLGNFTPYLLYLIPFISLSNLVFVITYKNLKNPLFNIFLPALFKSLLLFTATYVLVRTIPLLNIFLTTMGLIQFTTAILGTLLATITIKASSDI